MERDPLSLKLRIKTKLKGSVEGLAAGLLRLGVAPNAITMIGLLLSLSAAYIYYVAASQPVWLYYAVVLFSLSGLCDALDGTMARLSNKASSFGSYLDSVLDRYSDAVVIVGITLGAAGVSLLGVDMVVWGFAAVIGSIIVSYSRAKAESLGTKLEGIGIAERAERAVILVVASLLLHPDIGVFIIAIAANLTVVQRGIHVYGKLKVKKEKAEG